jgi:hypothetical protein
LQRRGGCTDQSWHMLGQSAPVPGGSRGGVLISSCSQQRAWCSTRCPRTVHCRPACEGDTIAAVVCVCPVARSARAWHSTRGCHRAAHCRQLTAPQGCCRAPAAWLHLMSSASLRDTQATAAQGTTAQATAAPGNSSAAHATPRQHYPAEVPLLQGAGACERHSAAQHASLRCTTGLLSTVANQGWWQSAVFRCVLFQLHPS